MDFAINSIKCLFRSCYCNYECNAKCFKQNFKTWTSGNNHIDKFIQKAQLSDHNYNECQAPEWISYNRLNDIEYIVEGKIGRAKWIDGCIKGWDHGSQNWKRENQNMLVVLKSLNNTEIITSEYINKV